MLRKKLVQFFKKHPTLVVTCVVLAINILLSILISGGSIAFLADDPGGYGPPW